MHIFVFNAALRNARGMRRGDVKILEEIILPSDEQHKSNEGAFNVPVPKQQQSAQFGIDKQRQQQLCTSAERLSPSKLRCIQTQPSTFIIDLPTSKQQLQQQQQQ